MFEGQHQCNSNVWTDRVAYNVRCKSLLPNPASLPKLASFHCFSIGNFIHMNYFPIQLCVLYSPDHSHSLFTFKFLCICQVFILSLNVHWQLFKTRVKILGSAVLTYLCNKQMICLIQILRGCGTKTPFLTCPLIFPYTVVVARLLYIRPNLLSMTNRANVSLILLVSWYYLPLTSANNICCA